jgi:hypothetical protein
MTRPRIAILYEDERGEIKDFPLHTLVCACVGDTLELDVHSIRPLLRAIPKKGNSKLLTACLKEVAKMPEPHVLALFDGDELHRLLQLHGDIPAEQLHEELRQKIAVERTCPFVLHRNTETLVEAAAGCLGTPRPSGKDKSSRDTLLARAAWAPTRGPRDCIREAVASFAEFVDEVARVVELVRAPANS